jgi:hypothetical protein
MDRGQRYTQFMVSFNSELFADGCKTCESIIAGVLESASVYRFTSSTGVRCFEVSSGAHKFNLISYLV